MTIVFVLNVAQSKYYIDISAVVFQILILF